MADPQPMTPDPAHRHGGPGAGWYRPGPDGWQAISDAEAAGQRYPDMAHFMHDPNGMTQCPVPAVPQQPMLIMHADRDLTAEQVDEIKRRFAATLASPQMPVVMPPDPLIRWAAKVDPEQFLAQFDNPDLRAPIYGRPSRRVRRFLLWLLPARKVRLPHGNP